MGTVSDKLTYLNTTKVKIKDAINLTGANITDDTFRSYPDKLKQAYVDIINNGTDELYSNFPKVSQTGEEIALNGTYNAPMGIELKGNTEQTTYTGKNLFHDLSSTKSEVRGVSVTNNNDGSITINGTYDKTGNLNIFLTESNQETSGYTNNMTLLKANTQYSISATLINGTMSNTNLNLYVSSRTTDDYTFAWNYKQISYSNGKWSITFTTDSSDIYLGGLRFSFISSMSEEFNNAKFVIQVEQGTATDYEPYVGGVPSPNPDYPQDIQVVKGNNTINVHGKNLFNKNSTVQGILNADGTIGSGGSYQTSDFIKIDSTKTYTKNVSGSRRIKLYDKNKNVISTESYEDILDFNVAKTFTIPYSNAVYIRYSLANANVETNQLEQGTTATTYQAYTSTDYSVNLGSMELCKIGDYQDLILKSTGKNLFDVNGNVYNGTIDKVNNGFRLTNDSNYRVLGISFTNPIPAGTYKMTYTIRNSTVSNVSNVQGSIRDDSGALANYSINNTGETTFTISSEANKLYIYISSTQEQSGVTITLDDFMISTIGGDYEPDGKVWYKKGYIGKVVLDGSNVAFTQKSGSFKNTIWMTDTNYPNNLRILSNYFVEYTSTYPYDNDVEGIYLENNRIKCAFGLNSDLTTLQLANNWLSTHNTTVYYALATPTTTEITDTDLINQLNTLKNAKSIDDKTFINQTNADLSFIISASALSKN